MIGIRSTTRFLRFIALLQILTAGIAVVPTECIAVWHAWLGLGEMPPDPVLLYGIRGGAFVQGAIGVLLWVIATDVVRYRALVVTSAAIYLVGAPAFYGIDAVVGLPRFWCLFDFISCLVVGGVLMALVSRVEPT